MNNKIIQNIFLIIGDNYAYFKNLSLSTIGPPSDELSFLREKYNYIILNEKYGGLSRALVNLC